jgi:hypothetical protein
MKVALIVIVVLLLGSVTRPCSPDDKQRLFGSSPATPPPNARGQDGIPTIPYDEMLRRVAGLSKQTGIVNLKQAHLRVGLTEIRVWKAFGLITPRCIVIKVANGNASAFLVTVKIAGSKEFFTTANQSMLTRHSVVHVLVGTTSLFTCKNTESDLPLT